MNIRFTESTLESKTDQGIFEIQKIVVTAASNYLTFVNSRSNLVL